MRASSSSKHNTSSVLVMGSRIPSAIKTSYTPRIRKTKSTFFVHERINLYRVSSSANGSLWLMGGRSPRMISNCRLGDSQAELMKRIAREANMNRPEAL